MLREKANRKSAVQYCQSDAWIESKLHPWCDNKLEKTCTFTTCWSKQEGFTSNPGCGDSNLSYCGQYPEKGKGYWTTCPLPMFESDLSMEKMNPCSDKYDPIGIMGGMMENGGG